MCCGTVIPVVGSNKLGNTPIILCLKKEPPLLENPGYGPGEPKGSIIYGYKINAGSSIAEKTVGNHYQNPLMRTLKMKAFSLDGWEDWLQDCDAN